METERSEVMRRREEKGRGKMRGSELKTRVKSDDEEREG